jgi:hypothetical protein
VGCGVDAGQTAPTVAVPHKRAVHARDTVTAARSTINGVVSLFRRRPLTTTGSDVVVAPFQWQPCSRIDKRGRGGHASDGAEGPWWSGGHGRMYVNRGGVASLTCVRGGDIRLAARAFARAFSRDLNRVVPVARSVRVPPRSSASPLAGRGSGRRNVDVLRLDGVIQLGSQRGGGHTTREGSSAADISAFNLVKEELLPLAKQHAGHGTATEDSRQGHAALPAAGRTACGGPRHTSVVQVGGAAAPTDSAAVVGDFVVICVVSCSVVRCASNTATLPCVECLVFHGGGEVAGHELEGEVRHLGDQHRAMAGGDSVLHHPLRQWWLRRHVAAFPVLPQGLRAVSISIPRLWVAVKVHFFLLIPHGGATWLLLLLLCSSRSLSLALVVAGVALVLFSFCFFLVLSRVAAAVALDASSFAAFSAAVAAMQSAKAQTHATRRAARPWHRLVGGGLM